MFNFLAEIRSSRTGLMCLLFTCLIAPSFASDPAIKPALAHKFFAEAEAISKADHGGLWGRPLYGPMLFVDRATRQVAANQQDAEKRLTPDGDIFVGALPAEVNIANTATFWSGTKWTMMMWPISGEKNDRAVLMAHELFHRIQDDVGLPMGNPSNPHLDSKDGRVWLQLEWRALAAALRQSGDARKAAIQDALVFRAYRRSRFPSAADQENALEMNEGMAEYTGKRLCGLDRDKLVEKVAARLDSAQGDSGYMRGFAYVSGPPYGLLLDDAAPTWRKGLTPKSDLGDLLGRAYSIQPPKELAAESTRRADRYDGRSLIASESHRAEEQAKRHAELRLKFVTGPVLILPLTERVQYSFNPNGLQALDNLGSVYSTLRVTDEWGILDAGGGALMKRVGERPSEVIVPAPASSDGSKLIGDGYTLTLNPGWSPVGGTRQNDRVPKRD